MTNAKRTSWNEYFMRIARTVATRATCDRKHVGAVIVRDKTILSTGYNGSIRGTDHCDEVGHLMEDGHCVRTIHAEANAILQAAKNGVRIQGADLYVTASPCWPCFGLVANAGILRIFFGEAYRPDDPGPKRVIEVAERIGVELISAPIERHATSGVVAEAHRLTLCQIANDSTSDPDELQLMARYVLTEHPEESDYRRALYRIDDRNPTVDQIQAIARKA